MSPRPRTRMPWLLLMLAAIVALRWWDTTSQKEPPDIAQAAPRSAGALPVRTSSQTVVAPAADLNGGTRAPEDGEPANLFAVRTPPPASPPPPPPPQPKAPPPAPPPPPPPPVVANPGPPMPPLQVIGTWKDEQGASVFLAGPQGVVQARPGDTLLSQYTVTQVQPQRLVMRHLASDREVALPIPFAPATAPRPLP